MSKHLERWLIINSDSAAANFLLPFSRKPNTFFSRIGHYSAIKTLNLRSRGVRGGSCPARRRVRYEDEKDDDEDYGHNEQLAMLESYTQSATDEALIVHAAVDDEQVEVIIFKGFSSCLSYRTSPDPSRSVLPARAVIKSIDRIKGPFDPTNIEYLQMGITWDSFESILLPSNSDC